jgi:hypothetical protein
VKQLSYLLGIALNNALLYQTIEDERKLKEYIIDNTEEGVCILDMKKKIVSASKFLEVMSGLRCPVQRMTGEYFFELFPNFINTQLEEKMNEVLVYGFKRTVFLEVLEIKIIPYLDDKGRVKRLIVIFIPLEKKPFPHGEAKDKNSV